MVWGLLGKNMALVENLRQILKILDIIDFEDKKEVLFLREIKTAHLYDCQLYSAQVTTAFISE